MEVMTDSSDMRERGLWNTWQRNNVEAFPMLTGFRPLDMEKTTGGREIDIRPGEVPFVVKCEDHGLHANRGACRECLHGRN